MKPVIELWSSRAGNAGANTRGFDRERFVSQKIRSVSMTSSFRDDSYRPPNFGIEGASPSYRPWWIPRQMPPIIPAPSPAPWPSPTFPGGQRPFPAPLPAPQKIPANGVDPASQGGLLGRLFAALAEQARGAPDIYENGNGSPARAAETDATPQEAHDSQEDAVRILGRRVVRY